jgi:hypothetical protein
LETHLAKVYEAEHGKSPTVYVTRPDDGVAKILS